MADLQHDAVRFIQISDTHISADPEEKFDELNTYDSLNHVIQAIQQQGLQYDFVIVSGDLVHEPTHEAYERLKDLLRQFPCPVYCLPGNHDDPQQMQQVLNEGNITTPKQLVFDDWQLLLMSSYKPDSHGGHVSDTEIQYLHEAIAQYPDKEVAIAVHHPCVSVQSSWMDSMMIDNADEYLTALQQHKAIRLVVFGHVHQIYEAQFEGITFHSCPSTCIQFKPYSDAYRKDALPPGFRHITLKKNGFIESFVLRVS